MPTENINTIFGLFRLIAFQKTKKFKNPSSINIFLIRKKFGRNRKFSKIFGNSGSDESPDTYEDVCQAISSKSCSYHQKKVSTFGRIFFTISKCKGNCIFYMLSIYKKPAQRDFFYKPLRLELFSIGFLFQKHDKSEFPIPIWLCHIFFYPCSIFFFTFVKK